MVTAVCDRVVVVQEPIIRVTSGQSITLEAKGTDTSLRMNFMVSNNNFAMMYYFVRFFKLRSSHCAIGKSSKFQQLFLIFINLFLQLGALHVSAYTFDDANRAFASIRVGVQSVAPIREIDFHGNTTCFGIADGCIPVDEENTPPNREYAKLKFIIFKHVWENWSNEALVRKRENLREAFTDYLEGLYDDLSNQDF